MKIRKESTAGRTTVRSAGRTMGFFGTVTLLASFTTAPVQADDRRETLNRGVEEIGNCMPLFPNNPLGKRDEETAQWTDNNPNVYVGKNAQFLNHEGEGLVIVEGDLLVEPPSDYAWAYQLGAGAGGGSGSWPAAQALMLAVSGNVEARGAGLNIALYERPGKWYVGGSAVGNIQYETIWSPSVGEWGGNLPMRVDSLVDTPADGYRTQLDEFQDLLSTQPVTGVVSIRSYAPGLVLTGDGNADLQVFELTEEQFQQLNTEGESGIDFEDIPENSTIILRAVGSFGVELTGSLQFSMNGKQIVGATGDWDNWGSQSLSAWGNLTQRLLWHFPNQENIEIGVQDSRHHQFTGSIFAGQEDGTLYANASTNGRVIAYGDFTAGAGHGQELGRMEFHAFPLHLPGVLSCTGQGTASFALNKVLTDTDGNPLADSDQRAFEQASTYFRVAATWEDQNGQTRTSAIDLPADGTGVPGPQDVVVGDGAIVSFSEVQVVNPPEGFHFEGAEFSSGNSHGLPLQVEVKDTNVVAVTLTNRYSKTDLGTGSFSLRKVVDHPVGDNLLSEALFTVKAAWVIDEEEHSELFELAGDGTVKKSHSQIPAGTEVTFEEVSRPEPPTGWKFQDVRFNPETVTISAGRTASVTATNTYTADEPTDDVGGFSLSKSLCCTEALDSLSESLFVVEASWENNGEAQSQSFELLGNGTVVAGPQDLPVGTEVTFEEVFMPTAPAGWEFEEVQFSPDHLVIGAGENVTVTATNVYAAAPEEIPFRVSKAFAGGITQAEFSEGDYFTVEASWTPEGDEQLPVVETMQIPADGSPRDSSATVPAGTVVTFRETDSPGNPEGWEFIGATVTPKTIVVDGQETAEVLVTNEYRQTGSFMVAKQLSGEVAADDFPEGTAFTVEASWEDTTGAAVSEILRLPADGSAVQSRQSIAVGTEVSFTELDVPTLPGWNFDEVEFSPAQLIIESGAPSLVTATNTYAREETSSAVGSLKVRKVVEGITPENLADVDFQITATWMEGSEPRESTVTVSGDGTPEDFDASIPAGTTVNLSEKGAPEIPGYEWRGVAFSSSEVVIDAKQEVTVTATNTYANRDSAGERGGGFSLVKEVHGVSSNELPPGTVFEVIASWEEDGTVVTQSFTLPANGSVQSGPQDLPAGTRVTFKEIDVPEPAGYKWEEAVFSDPELVVEDGELHQITLVNKYSKVNEGGSLPVTGAAGIGALLVVALGALAVGLTILMRRRHG